MPRSGFSMKRVALAVLVIIAGALVLYIWRPAPIRRVMQAVEGQKTVEQRLAEYGPAARARLRPLFRRAGVPYPPAMLVLVGLKQEKTLQVYAANRSERWTHITSYPILAASGTSGPKLKQGDRQVPEGIYRVVFLNPNSLYHLSLRLNYPSAFDRRMAKLDGRTELGQDIMIHGSNCSIGCLAMGDPASEDLFVLAADTGIGNIEVILSPVDFRKTHLDSGGLKLPAWTDRLYEKIERELRLLPAATAHS